MSSLFEQVEHLDPHGGCLSGEPEILHEIEDYFRQVEFYPIIRDQTKMILEFVPEVFPEDWKSPGEYDELMNPQQRQAYLEIANAGIQSCHGPIIQKVIELALQYREQYSK